MGSPATGRPVVAIASNHPVSATASELGGALEVVTSARIAGWAIDRRAVDHFLEVEIRSGEEVIGRVRADRPRADLARAGLGDGSHGFEWRPSEPLAPERLPGIEAVVRAGADGGQPVPLPKRGPDGTFSPIARAAQPPGWVNELAALCKSIERHAQRLDAVASDSAGAKAGAATEDGGRIKELLAAMSVRLESVDGLQPRLDALAARVEQLANARLGERKAHRGLAWAVALTASVAMASLGTGLVNYFR